jgi:CBS domain-containing protein
MRVQEIMTKAVQTVPAEVGAEQAWNLMRAKAIHHLVVTLGSRIVGVLSDRDVGGGRGASFRQNRSVMDLMTAPAVTVSPETTVRKAANLMRGRSIGSLVVTSGGKVRGIVTVADLLELVGRGIDRSAASPKRWTLTHRTPHKKTAPGRGVW